MLDQRASDPLIACQTVNQASSAQISAPSPPRRRRTASLTSSRCRSLSNLRHPARFVVLSHRKLLAQSDLAAPDLLRHPAKLPALLRSPAIAQLPAPREPPCLPSKSPSASPPPPPPHSPIELPPPTGGSPTASNRSSAKRFVALVHAQTTRTSATNVTPPGLELELEGDEPAPIPARSDGPSPNPSACRASHKENERTAPFRAIRSYPLHLTLTTSPSHCQTPMRHMPAVPPASGEPLAPTRFRRTQNRRRRPGRP